MFYNVCHTVSVICCTRIKWHTYGKVYLLAVFFQLPEHTIWHGFSPHSLIFYLHATYSCLPNTFYPSGKHPHFTRVCWTKQVRWAFSLLFVSYQLLFPKACELSVALLKGSCLEAPGNIFSIRWYRTRLPSTPGKPLSWPPKTLCRRKMGSVLGSQLKQSCGSLQNWSIKLGGTRYLQYCFYI